jgi:uncharacterized protein (TIGR02117 family)
MRFRLKWLVAAVLALLSLPLVYEGVAFVLLLAPTGARQIESGQAAQVQAYVLSNGVHTDLVLPLQADGVDWSTYFPRSDFRAVSPKATYIAIGWGDRNFYLYTPQWKDLTASVALSAMLGRDSAVLHVSYLQTADLAGAYSLPLNSQQYQALQSYVLASLKTKGRAEVVSGVHYDDNDAFYEASGRYNLFNTCNTWTGEALRQAGVKVSRWTPFDTLVTWYLPSAMPN